MSYIHESVEQTNLFKWVEVVRNKYPDINLLYHIPNGGSRNKLEAANLKRQGVRAGVPDLCLPVPRGDYHGLYIELKAGTNKTSIKQQEWLRNLSNQGYYTAVCRGWEEASNTILSYLKGFAK